MKWYEYIMCVIVLGGVIVVDIVVEAVILVKKIIHRMKGWR
jgi:hypothetical protein